MAESLSDTCKRRVIIDVHVYCYSAQ